MKLWILGSGTLIPDLHRGPPAHCVQTDGALVLLDCGVGALRTMAGLGLDWTGLTHVVLSHFHTDHVGGLAPLLFSFKHGLDHPRDRELVLLGPVGLATHLRALEGTHGAYILDPGFPLVVQEISEGAEWSDTDAGICLNAFRTGHTERSLAFRLEADRCVLAYTGDTGPSAELGRSLAGCHVLVAECSRGDDVATDNHLSPRSLAELAGQAKPDLLVTVHTYPPLDPESVPTLVRGHGYEGKVVAAVDGLGVEWEAELRRISLSGVDQPPWRG